MTIPQKGRSITDERVGALFVERAHLYITADVKVPLLAQPLCLLGAYVNGAVKTVYRAICRKIGGNLYLQEVNQIFASGDETITVTPVCTIIIFIGPEIAHQCSVELVWCYFSRAVNAIPHVFYVSVLRQTIGEVRNGNFKSGLRNHDGLLVKRAVF